TSVSSPRDFPACGWTRCASDARSRKPTRCSSSAPLCSASPPSFCASCSRARRVTPATPTPKRDSCRGAAGALTAAVLIGALAPTVQAATRFDPALRFRQIATAHFVIYFHQGEDRLARRLATIAEETWRTLQQRLGVRPPAGTRVVLADQTEFANGYAT